MASATGSCLCGGVRFEVAGPMRPVIYCHCSQCRKTSGHFVAASACNASDLVMVANSTLAWFDSSPHARRGFCGTCGGNLFWKPVQGNHVSIMAGTIEKPTGLQAIAHIYVADVSDYHSIVDGLPQYDDQGPENLGDA